MAVVRSALQSSPLSAIVIVIQYLVLLSSALVPIFSDQQTEDERHLVLSAPLPPLLSPFRPGWLMRLARYILPRYEKGFGFSENREKARSLSSFSPPRFARLVNYGASDCCMGVRMFVASRSAPMGFDDESSFAHGTNVQHFFSANYATGYICIIVIISFRYFSCFRFVQILL